MSEAGELTLFGCNLASIDSVNPIDYKILAQVIASTDNLVKKLNNQIDENAKLKKMLHSLKESANQVNSLYEKEREKLTKMEENNKNLEEKIIELNGIINSLENEKINLECLSKQSIAELEGKLRHFSEIGKDFLLYGSLLIDNGIMSQTALKKFAEFRTFLRNEGICLDVKKTIKTKLKNAIDKKDEQHNQPLKVTIGTNTDLLSTSKSVCHKGTITTASSVTRATTTLNLIKTNDVGTMFPENESISFEEIFQETITDIPDLIEGIEDLKWPTKDSEIQTENFKKKMKNVGVITELQNIRKIIDYKKKRKIAISADKNDNIFLKRERSSTPNIDQQPTLTTNRSIFNPTFDRLWSLMGQTLFTIIDTAGGNIFERNRIMQEREEIFRNLLMQQISSIVEPVEEKLDDGIGDENCGKKKTDYEKFPDCPSPGGIVDSTDRDIFKIPTRRTDYNEILTNEKLSELPQKSINVKAEFRNLGNDQSKIANIHSLDKSHKVLKLNLKKSSSKLMITKKRKFNDTKTIVKKPLKRIKLCKNSSNGVVMTGELTLPKESETQWNFYNLLDAVRDYFKVPTLVEPFKEFTDNEIIMDVGNVLEVDRNYSPMSPRQDEDFDPNWSVINIPLECPQPKKNNKFKDFAQPNSLVNILIQQYDFNKNRAIMSNIIAPKSNESCSPKMKILIDIIQTYLNGDWTTSGALNNCLNELTIQDALRINSNLINRSIVTILGTTDDDLIYNRHECLAPAMPKTHQQLLLLVYRLSQSIADDNGKNFITQLLKYLDRIIFNFKSDSIPIKSLISLTYFYIGLMDLDIGTNQCKSKVRLFLYKALYYFNFKSIPMVFMILKAYPGVLPRATSTNYDNVTDALVQTIQAVLMNMRYYDKVNNEAELASYRKSSLLALLTKYYGYEIGQPKREDIIKMLINRIESNQLYNVSYSLVLLAKRFGCEWANSHIVKLHLSPLLNQLLTTTKSPSRDAQIITCIQTISSIIKSYPTTTEHIAGYQQMFVSILNLSLEQNSEKIQEAAVEAIIKTSRFGVIDVYSRINRWMPSFQISRKLLIMLRTLIHRKAASFWINLSQEMNEDINGIFLFFQIDVDENLLKQNCFRLEPLLIDYLKNREFPLKVDVIKGSIDTYHDYLEGLDAVVAVEVVEHLYPKELDRLPYNIFHLIKPKIIIFTTPNYEFNVLFKNKTRPNNFRHDDHKFEWTREQFEDWANNLCERYSDYHLQFFGIGPGPLNDKENINFGCCSQMVVFVRNDLTGSIKIDNNNSITKSEIEYHNKFATNKTYDILFSYDYPFDERDRDEKIHDEYLYQLTKFKNDPDEKYFNVEKKQYEINIEILMEAMAMAEINLEVGVDELKENLMKNNYSIDHEGNFIILPDDQFSSDEENNYN